VSSEEKEVEGRSVAAAWQLSSVSLMRPQTEFFSHSKQGQQSKTGQERMLPCAAPATPTCKITQVMIISSSEINPHSSRQANAVVKMLWKALIYSIDVRDLFSLFTAVFSISNLNILHTMFSQLGPKLYNSAAGNTNVLQAFVLSALQSIPIQTCPELVQYPNICHLFVVLISSFYF